MSALTISSTAHPDPHQAFPRSRCTCRKHIHLGSSSRMDQPRARRCIPPRSRRIPLHIKPSMEESGKIVSCLHIQRKEMWNPGFSRSPESYPTIPFNRLLLLTRRVTTLKTEVSSVASELHTVPNPNFLLPNSFIHPAFHSSLHSSRHSLRPLPISLSSTYSLTFSPTVSYSTPFCLTLDSSKHPEL